MNNIFYNLFLSPRYISNIINNLIILTLILKNNFLLHSLIPLCLTNAIVIFVIILSIEKLNNKKNDKMIKYFNDNIYKFKLFELFYHFILPIIILFNNYHIKRKQYSNITFSLLISTIILFLYSHYFNKKTYEHINLNSNNLVYFIPIYLILLLIITIFYFY